MNLESIGATNKRNLVRRELDTQGEVLKSFQTAYKAIQEKIDLNFLSIREAIAAGQTVSPALLFERTRLEGLLSEVGFEIDKLSLELGRITNKAQKDSILAAIAETEQFFQIGNVLDKAVNSFDSGAVRELAGIAGDGSPITKLFSQLKPNLVDSIKSSLITGVALGSSPNAIASDIKTALGTTTAHALTIARTETNRVYRESTRRIFDENKNIVFGYVWISARDLRTCPICWAMHGRIFPTSEKFATHPNCRCVLVGSLSKGEKMTRGSERFKKLTPAQQKEILGSARFDLYSQEKATLEDFVGEKMTDFGKSRYIRPLSELNVKADKPKKSEPIKKPVAPKIANTPIGRPKTAKQATEQLERVAKRIDARLAEIQELKKNLSTEPRTEKQFLELIGILSEETKLMSTKQKELLDVLRVEKPTNLKLNFTSKFKKVNKDRIQTAIDDFNSLVDEKFLKNVEFGTKKAGRARAYFDGKNIAGYEDITAGTIVHEASHGLEQKGAGLLDQTLEFYDYRTKNDKIVSLKIFNRRYAASEKTKVDKFFSPYVGKLPYQYKGKPFATEIMSMGVQKYYENPLEFAKDDPEYFEFIFKVLRGEKWSRP